ncbi:FixH family protein [Uliginosibacterium paludis]|uniref:FixH family protein n=1 Tax=Uliginosibacterium paludis TaxID=1615952 RepID=A0ABV2CK54_9RHOO
MTRLMAAGAPWYRQGWPWFLMSLPAAAVIAGLATWYVAWKSNDGLVAEDYYKQGLEINRSLESQQMAKQLGVSGLLSYENGVIRLRVSAAREISFPDVLELNILSPVRAGNDRNLKLTRNGDHYEARMPPLPDGHWNLALADGAGTWRILGAELFPLKGEAALHP